MISHRLDLALTGGVEARVLFTSRGGAASGGSSRSPYAWANLGSHVGDDPAAVVANRRALAEALGVPASAMTFMHPDHGRGVAAVSEPTGVTPGAEITSVDALVTATAGIGLVALAADCVPVILVEPVAGVVAAVHSGWRGLALDVVGAAVGEMVAAGARAAGRAGPAGSGDLRVLLPGARGAGARRWRGSARRRSRPPPTASPPSTCGPGWSARLDELGATSTLVGGCTAEDPGLYSHRRDGLTGRQGGAVAIVAAA